MYVGSDFEWTSPRIDLVAEVMPKTRRETESLAHPLHTYIQTYIHTPYMGTGTAQTRALGPT